MSSRKYYFATSLIIFGNAMRTETDGIIDFMHSFQSALNPIHRRSRTYAIWTFISTHRIHVNAIPYLNTFHFPIWWSSACTVSLRGSYWNISYEIISQYWWIFDIRIKKIQLEVRKKEEKVYNSLMKASLEHE